MDGEGRRRWRRRRCWDPCSQGASGAAVSMANPPWEEEEEDAEDNVIGMGKNGWEMGIGNKMN